MHLLVCNRIAPRATSPQRTRPRASHASQRIRPVWWDTIPAVQCRETHYARATAQLGSHYPVVDSELIDEAVKVLILSWEVNTNGQEATFSGVREPRTSSFTY